MASTAVAQSNPSPPPAPAPGAPTVSYASNDPNYWLWTAESVDVDPQPIRGGLGTDILGPENIPLEIENSNTLAPPTTDNGVV